MGAPRSLMRPLVGAPPPIALPLSMAPFARELSSHVVVLPLASLRVGARCLLRLDSLRPVCDGSWALCCPSLCTRDRSPALCGIFRVCCVALCSASCRLLISPTPRLMGAPPSLVWLLEGSSLLIVIPVLVAPLRAPSFLVAVLPLPPMLVGLRCCLNPGSRALLRPLGRVRGRVAAFCHATRRCSSARRFQLRLPCRLLLFHSCSSAAALAWARGLSAHLCATARARCATFCCSALGRSSALRRVSR